MKRLIAWTGVALLVLAWAGSSRAQQAPAAGDNSAYLLQEMTGVNRSLADIATLLDRILSHQEVDILIKRIQLEERRLAPLQSQLRGAQDDVTHIEDRLLRLRTRREELDERIDERVQQGKDTSESPERLERREIELTERWLKDRLATSEQKVIEMENDLADARLEVEVLEEILDERLGLR